MNRRMLILIVLTLFAAAAPAFAVSGSLDLRTTIYPSVVPRADLNLSYGVVGERWKTEIKASLLMRRLSLIQPGIGFGDYRLYGQSFTLAAARESVAVTAGQFSLQRPFTLVPQLRTMRLSGVALQLDAANMDFQISTGTRRQSSGFNPESDPDTSVVVQGLTAAAEWALGAGINHEKDELYASALVNYRLSPATSVLGQVGARSADGEAAPAAALHVQTRSSVRGLSVVGEVQQSGFAGGLTPVQTTNIGLSGWKILDRLLAKAATELVTRDVAGSYTRTLKTDLELSWSVAGNQEVAVYVLDERRSSSASSRYYGLEWGLGAGVGEYSLHYVLKSESEANHGHSLVAKSNWSLPTYRLDGQVTLTGSQGLEQVNGSAKIRLPEVVSNISGEGEFRFNLRGENLSRRSWTISVSAVHQSGGATLGVGLETRSSGGLVASSQYRVQF